MGSASQTEPLDLSDSNNSDEGSYLLKTFPVDDGNAQEDLANLEVGGMMFEDMFYDPVSHKTAWNLLHQTTSKRPSTENNRLRQKTTTNKTLTEESVRPKTRNTLPVPDIKSEEIKKSKKEKKVMTDYFHLEKTLSPNPNALSESASAESVDKPTPQDDQEHDNGYNGISQGVAMINELLARYDNCKKMYKKKSTKYDFVGTDSDSSELEEISGDEFNPDSKSDFMKYSVPQYDLKIKLCDMHYREINKLPLHQIGKICRDILPELKEIQNEVLPNRRHDIFKTCGSLKQSALQELIVAKPFNATQDTCILNIIRDQMVGDEDPTENNGEMLHYISLVLVPEALIRIYAKVNCLHYDMAEKELRFGAGYDGPVPEELVQKLELKQKLKSPVKPVESTMRKRKQVVYQE